MSSHVIKIEQVNGCERSECHGQPDFVLDLPPRGGFWNTVQVILEHDPFDAM